MKLITYCSRCKTDIKVKSSATTRPDLQMEKGSEFTVFCPTCNSEDIKHVNDVKAETNPITILVALGLGVVVTVFLWNMFGAIGTVSFIIPYLFWQSQSNAVKGFNSYLVKRKKKD
jgi:ribosomal protein L44E